ncbi:MAG: toxic anion resistance protein [Lachnospiraceae bacterium]|nr:toxic anion resistance protein [Lachnospiraceae bacterium]
MADEMNKDVTQTAEQDLFADLGNAVPTLEFGTETAAGAAAVQEAPKVEEPAQAVMEEERILTPEELRQVEEFSKKIDVTDTKAIMSYGVGTQKKMSDFSEKTLDSVRTKDLGEVGDMVSGLITELKNFDVDEEEKGLFSFFKKGSNKMNEVKAKYAKVETNVEKISQELEKHQMTLLKDVEVLDKMYELNLMYFKELTMYILAGKKRLKEVRENELAQAQKKAAESGLPEDAQAAKDLAAQCDRFEKKLHDLQLTRTVAMQTGPQIRMIQSSDTVMAEKIQSTIVNTIPLWKSQMVIAIGIEHANQAAKAEQEVTNMTNELLRKNADKLKQATIESAKAAERGIVDIETLKHTNEMLISTMDEVITIQTEGKQRRAQAESELAQIEAELRKKLLEASRT